jgi:hypothetical protein
VAAAPCGWRRIWVDWLAEKMDVTSSLINVMPENLILDRPVATPANPATAKRIGCLRDRDSSLLGDVFPRRCVSAGTSASMPPLSSGMRSVATSA